MPHSVEPSEPSSAYINKALIFVGAAALAATAGYINTVMQGSLWKTLRMLRLIWLVHNPGALLKACWLPVEKVQQRVWASL